jgi:hypothetical protein
MRWAGQPASAPQQTVCPKYEYQPNAKAWLLVGGMVLVAVAFTATTLGP